MGRTARAYFVGVTLVGVGVILYSALQIPGLGYTWLLLALLTWVSSAFPIKIPGVLASFYISETFVFTQVLLFGFAPGVVTLAIDGLLISWRRRYKEARRYCFNLAEPAISVSVAGSLFFWLLPIEPMALAGSSPRLSALLLPTLAMGAGYFLVNSWLATLAVTFDTGAAPYRLWRSHFLWTALNTVSSASLGLVLAIQLPVGHMKDFGFLKRPEDFAGLAVIGPLLLISYLTFRTSAARVEDTNQHLRELNRLYLSTVETLAMAIDAKDQITHGHIRRVQTYAVALAKGLRVTDEPLMKAIEAAALLHDMGKLSIPEFILNKPGKLTPAEYERMKLHAPIGASILSQIDFPYPVAPIVRHHHENWDGSGYPDGLAGEAHSDRRPHHERRGLLRRADRRPPVPARPPRARGAGDHRQPSRHHVRPGRRGRVPRRSRRHPPPGGRARGGRTRADSPPAHAPPRPCTGAQTARGGGPECRAWHPPALRGGRGAWRANHARRRGGGARAASQANGPRPAGRVLRSRSNHRRPRRSPRIGTGRGRPGGFAHRAGERPERVGGGEPHDDRATQALPSTSAAGFRRPGRRPKVRSAHRS